MSNPHEDPGDDGPTEPMRPPPRCRFAEALDRLAAHTMACTRCRTVVYEHGSKADMCRPGALLLLAANQVRRLMLTN